MNESQYALLRLNLTPNLGRVALFKLHQKFSDFQCALKASAAEWQEAGVPLKLHRQVPAENDQIVQTAVAQTISQNIRMISYWDDEYPALLRNIHDPPALLYLRGQLPKQDCFAIVGSRRATAGGFATTEALANTLAKHNLCIVSGMARGIDSAAHRGALAAGGRTIAVLGCGIDHIYPSENRRLHEEILQKNAIISEHPPGTPPLAGHFPGRNRIISGLSHGVLIVEATERSGSLITGDFALEQGRDLFAIPGALHHKNSKGTNRLLKEGAQMVTEANDILHSLWPGQIPTQEQYKQKSFTQQLSDAAAKVYRLLDFEPLHGDEIARKCGLTPMELSAILLDLELQGGIKALPGHHYIRSRL